MIATDIIRNIMEKEDVKPSALAERLKIKNNTLSERMTQKNISVRKLNEMLKAMNYKMVIVPQDVQVEDGWYELTIDGESPKEDKSPKLDQGTVEKQNQTTPPTEKKSSSKRIKLTPTIDLDALLADDEPVKPTKPVRESHRIKLV